MGRIWRHVPARGQGRERLGDTVITNARWLGAGVPADSPPVCFHAIEVAEYTRLLSCHRSY